MIKLDYFGRGGRGSEPMNNEICANCGEVLKNHIASSNMTDGAHLICPVGDPTDFEPSRVIVPKEFVEAVEEASDWITWAAQVLTLCASVNQEMVKAGRETEKQLRSMLDQMEKDGGK